MTARIPVEDVGITTHFRIRCRQRAKAKPEDVLAAVPLDLRSAITGPELAAYRPYEGKRLKCDPDAIGIIALPHGVIVLTPNYTDDSLPPWAAVTLLPLKEAP